MTATIQETELIQDTIVELTMGVLINKLNRDSLNSLIGKIKRFLSKIVSTSNMKSFEVLEVNTFLFIKCNFPLHTIATDEQRKDVITQLETIIKNYCNKECDSYSKEIGKNIEIRDITKMLNQLVLSSTTSNTKELIQRIEEKKNAIASRVIERVSGVLLNSFIIIWDFPDDFPDIIMFPDLILKRDIADKKHKTPLRLIAEDLLIAQFGKACSTNLQPILSSNEEAITLLENLLLDKENVRLLEEQMSDKLWRTLRVIFGLLSSTQQSIVILLKQLKRISEVKYELTNAVEKLDYTPLMDYLMLIDTVTNCDEQTLRLNNLHSQAKNLYQFLLDIINKFKNPPEKEIEGIDLLSDVFVQILSEIQLMKYFADKFRDLAYFQSIPTEVEVEKLEKIDVKEDIILKGVSLFKTYRLVGSTVYALRGIDIDIKRGEMVAIVGPSGSGKTTLLNLLSGLDTPNRGAVFLLGRNIDTMSDSAVSMFRRKNMGFIFQYYNLVPQLTVLENVMLPGLMIGQSRKEVRKRALELIKEVDLERFQNQFPIKLSGGQMQRVTIARAMINDPAVLFADEPTGDLDSVTGKVVIDLISRFSKEKGTAVILVTHDLEMAKTCDKLIKVGDGKVISD